MSINADDASPKIRPALLTQSEIDWLLGQKEVSNAYERKLRHDINRKLQTLSRLELPLLSGRGFAVDVTAGSNAVTANCNTANTCPFGDGISTINIM